MREVLRFETDDGKIFSTKDLAEAHERLIRHKKWYEANKLYDYFGKHPIEWPEFIRWVSSNRKQLRNILNSIQG